MQEVKKPQTPSLPFLGTIHQKNASIEVKKCASPRDAYQARAQIALARRACALRALGLLLADGAPTVGGGKTF